MGASPQPTPAASPSPTPARTPIESRTLPLRFTGSGGEYFRLWIVNVCLSLLTLGIFSAWGKVRKKRYFYSHTTLDGTPFQYLGQPIPILKGRIVAAILFGAWYIGTNYMIELLPLVLLLMFTLAPWVLVRSAAFNARYSAFRNMTFEFRGSYWSAVKVLYGWGLIVLFTFGFAFSWWQHRIKQYMITRMHYGGIPGEFSATGGQFFRTYIIAGLVFGGVMVAASVVLGVVTAAGSRSEDGGPPLAYFVTFMIIVYALYVAAFAYVQAHIGNLVWNHTQLGPIRFESTLKTGDLVWLYATNAIAILGSAGLLIPWATVRMLKYRLAHFTVTLDGVLDAFEGSSATNVQAAGAEVGEFFDFDMSI